MSYRLHPSSGLLHPAWLASLALLATNDHILKGADVLPAVVTGKLSDLAGMVVAPLLLAVLLRVRSVRGWLACHVAVGLGFAAIQVSAEAASLWSGAMGMLGVPWTITRDLTDLLALPMLLVSAWGLLPALRRAARANARRTAEAGAAAVGLLCCVATSYEEEPPCCDSDTDTDTDTFGDGSTDDGGVEQELPPFTADVFLSNQTEEDQVVRIRALRTDVLIDCDEVAQDPGSLLRSSLFAPADAWTLPRFANLRVLEHGPGQAPCYAAWVEADTLSPTLLWWRDGDPGLATVPGEGITELPGQVILGYGSTGLALEGPTDLVWASQPAEPPAEGVCASQPDAERIGWSTPVPWGTAIIEAVDEGVDGCLSIDLQRSSETTETWYLCVPATSFPFVAGDFVELRLGGDETRLEVLSLDESGVQRPLPHLSIAAGQWLPQLEGVEMVALPLYDCGAQSEPECGTVERPMAIVVGGPGLEAAELVPGDGPTQLANEERVVEFTVGHAQERFVVDPACALGPDALGTDLEVVVAQWAPSEG